MVNKGARGYMELDRAFEIHMNYVDKGLNWCNIEADLTELCCILDTSSNIHHAAYTIVYIYLDLIEPNDDHKRLTGRNVHIP